MNDYELKALKEVTHWQQSILQDATYLDHQAKNWNKTLNKFIPEKVHRGLTSVFKHMCRGILLGSKITTEKGWKNGSLRFREAAIRKKMHFYTTTAAAEGGITGVGGIFLGFADFPLLVAIKIKLIFEIASIYGFNTSDYKERFYLLHIFLLSFSTHEKRREAYLKLADWTKFSKQLPDDIHDLDWRTFQEEYRDYTDLVKLPQLIPVIGAPFGAVINYRLTYKLGKDAMNAFRMRWFKSMGLLPGSAV